MLETDFILMMTAGFLIAPEEKTSAIVADFETAYTLDAIKKPGRVSIGGETESSANAEALPWIDWSRQLREQGLPSVTVSYIPYDGHGLAPHKAAAFASTVTYVLQTVANQAGHESVKSWFLQSQNSPRFAVSAAGFAAFIESQPEKKMCWSRIHQLINESNGLNNRPLVAAGGDGEYISGPEGEAVFDFLGDNLMSEIQIDALINKKTLVFSKEWDAYFDPPYGPSPFSAPAPDKEPVYFYLLEQVNAADLHAIVAAQAFAGSVWPELQRVLIEETPEILQGKTDPEALLKTGTEEEIQALGNLVCRVIASFCQEEEIFPVIPKTLAKTFGPDETDQLRARARGHTENFRGLKAPAEPWRFYSFRRMPEFDEAIQEPQEEKKETEFRTTLDAIARFAEEQTLTWFAGNFRLAAFIISPEIMNGEFSTETITAKATAAGYGDDYKETLAGSIFYVSKLFQMGWPKQKCFGLLAVSLTSVFGGMGSWNDQYVENDQAGFEAVSAAFFSAREYFFAVCLSHSEASAKS